MLDEEEGRWKGKGSGKGKDKGNGGEAGENEEWEVEDVLPSLEEVEGKKYEVSWTACCSKRQPKERQVLRSELYLPPSVSPNSR